MQILLPASLVSSGEGIPTICSRHGRESTTASKCRFVSRPPRWTAVLLLAGALPYLIVVTALRKTVLAPYWPLCGACTQRKRSLLFGGLATLAGAVMLFVLGIFLAFRITTTDEYGYTTTTSSMAGFGLFLLFLSFIAFITGLVTTSMSTMMAVAGGAVTADGMFIEFRNAAPSFTRWANGFLNAGQAIGSGYSPHAYSRGSGSGRSAAPGYGQTSGHGDRAVNGGQSR